MVENNVAEAFFINPHQLSGSFYKYGNYMQEVL